jgi:hypothetical protein
VDTIFIVSYLGNGSIALTGLSSRCLPKSATVSMLSPHANANKGLKFTNSDGNDLDALYPADDDDNDPNYDPRNDDDASYASSEDSDFVPADADLTSDDDNYNPELPDTNAELAGVERNNLPAETTGVDDAETAATTGVDDNTALEDYVTELEAELDNEIAQLDSDYKSDNTDNENDSDGKLDELDDTIEPIDDEEANDIRADASREQATTDNITDLVAKVVTMILDLLDNKYGQEIVGGKRAPLTITRGRTHDYLGMTLDYSEDGIVKIGVRDYVKKILGEMPEDMDGTATSPAGQYLFQIKDGIEELDKQTSEFFHATVAKLLFLCKRGRPDIQTAIAFLCQCQWGQDQHIRHHKKKTKHQELY